MTDREAIEALTDKTVVNPYLTLEALEIAIDALRERAERKTGKWIWVEDEKYRDYSTGNATYKCSLCYHTDLRSRTQKVPHCWWCGAEMEVDG